jgi:hypothetical protein
MLRLLRHLAFLVSLAFIAGIARDAHAGDAAAAQALFEQGKKLMAEKKYAEACPKFEESQKQDPGLGTQTNLAICYESMGRTATAWSLYLDVASQAKATNQPDREKKARDAAKALEGKLSKLTIQVDSPATGIEVKRNGEPVSQAMWGTAIPVDPGTIKLTAVAPDRKLWEKTITIEKPGDTSVTVPELEKGKPPAGYYPAPTASGAGTTPPPGGYYNNGLPPGLPPPPPRMKRRSGGLFGGGIAAISVGGVATLIGGIWWAAAAGVNDLGGDAGTTAPAATTVIGLALIGGGIAMVVVGGKKVPAGPNDGKALPFSPVPEVKVGLTNAQLKWQF